jgi:hypothetical protein
MKLFKHLKTTKNADNSVYQLNQPYFLTKNRAKSVAGLKHIEELNIKMTYPGPASYHITVPTCSQRPAQFKQI